MGNAMAQLVRGAVLNSYVEVARAAGLDPYRMIAAAGLPPATLTDPEIKVPAAKVGRLLEASAEESGKSDFGLRLAERRSLSNLGVLALHVREQPTIRKALEALVAYMHLHNEALQLKIHEVDGIVLLSVTFDVGRPVPIRQGVDLALGFLHQSLSRLIGKGWKPRAFHFTHAPPPSTSAHRRFFNTRLVFNGDFNGIELVARDLDAAVPASDSTMARHVQGFIDTLATPPSPKVAAHVRECISVMLPSGLCSADHVAQRLGVDRRTIHRHLAKEGETFSSLLDSVRTELVARYINNSERPLTLVAELLGFSGLSAFSRWFHNRFGQSASTWRSNKRPAA
jgi:AraC-like DNA-binding protein